ncbi:MAG: hypothetical protein JWO38_7173 [Gemmataceae bacterium]|nr:hypothetical protein [Gemmataceae bacterium]
MKLCPPPGGANASQRTGPGATPTFGRVRSVPYLPYAQ